MASGERRMTGAEAVEVMRAFSHLLANTLVMLDDLPPDERTSETLLAVVREFRADSQPLSPRQAELLDHLLGLWIADVEKAREDRDMFGRPQ